MASIDTNTETSVQKITVFQQNGSGERKIAGIRKYAEATISLEVMSIDEELPAIIDDGRHYLPHTLSSDLVLDFLQHEDLSHDLVALCHELSIPVISSGKKNPSKWVITPPT